MRLKLGCTLISNKQCFVRFIKETENYIRVIEDLYEHDEYRGDEEFDEVVAAIKFNELDKEFRSILTKDESLALRYLNAQRPDFDKPDNYESLISSSFDKWVEIFFKERNCLYEELNPIVLGKVLRLIRIDKDVKKTELAVQLGVDRATVFLIERGKRLPSLPYIYRFANIFGLTVDYILSRSLL